MPIPESTLSQWSHHRSAKASKQAHVSVRDALAAYEGVSEFNPDVFLHGFYKNGTNLRRDSEVDVVVRLPYQLKPRLVALTGQQLQGDSDHEAAQQRWRSFPRLALRGFGISYKNALFGALFLQSFPQLRVELLGRFARISANGFEFKAICKGLV